MDDNSRRVLVEYTGRLEDGTVFESSEESGPMDIIVGAGQVIKGIDETLAEMEVGETRTVTIPCEKAFGRYSEYNVQKRDLRYVPNADELPVGQRISVTGPGGQKVSALVQKIEDGYVYLDFNNKLAGKTLVYDLKIVEVLPNKTRRTPLSDYGAMARTESTRPVEEVPVFNNFLSNLGVTPEDIDQRYEALEKDPGESA